MEVDMLTLMPKFSSLTRLTNCSAALGLSNTAAQVVGTVRPLTTAWKSGFILRFQCANGPRFFDGLNAPPCRVSPRFTGLYSMAISRKRWSLGSAFGSLLLLLGIAKTM